MQIEFYYDIVCPFAYIASTRVEEAVGRHNGIVIWKPVLLGGIYDLIKAEQGKAGSASDVMPVNKKIAFSKDLERTIKRYKIDLNFHKNHPVKSLNAQRLLTYFKNQNKRKILSHKFFEAYWVKNLEVDKFEVLFKIVHECFGDFDKEDFLKTVSLLTITHLSFCIVLMAPGVPYFVIKSNEGGLSCFWGQDRIHFVESAITGRSIPQDRLYITKPLKFPQRIKFFFDFSSPWAFVGYMQLKRLKVEFGNLLEIECFPILLGKLFQNIGTPNMPALAMTSQ
ncbi:hypothetical protein HK099_004209 [Clydaea vesicula]|uniref:DSBA-like thioredoxin domain-containing protein n=1 Tax=Clydaea vesicula TaxID=447962 RepID=A0AAD5XYC7_9FUNG|nr:hypothetical protein HK099_004209 [Clydaea vesicula]